MGNDMRGKCFTGAPNRQVFKKHKIEWKGDWGFCLNCGRHTLKSARKAKKLK